MYTKSTKNNYNGIIDVYYIAASYFLFPFCRCLYFFTCSLQEAAGDTLQELWISYNNIEKLKEITVLAKLKVWLIILCMSERVLITSNCHIQYQLRCCTCPTTM